MLPRLLRLRAPDVTVKINDAERLGPPARRGLWRGWTDLSRREETGRNLYLRSWMVCVYVCVWIFSPPPSQ